jgi:hypothetical protein
MTEPASRPEPEPPADVRPDAATDERERFADLAERPVSEHVAAFEAEHDRLQRELGTIDQL